MLKKNYDVVKVDYHDVIEILPEYIVHHVLEDCRGVDETERHHLVLKMSITCPEGCFPRVSRLDAHQIVGSPKVDFGEDMPSSESEEG